MKYCLECGSSDVALKMPEGDNRKRYICNSCNYTHYENPRIICGSLPIYEGKVLLCKRDIEPRYGYWTLPAGFMENGESIEVGAARETQEEALAISENAALYCIFSLPHINQVHVFYKCDVKDGEYGAGSETSDAKLFELAEIPWDDIAFKTVGLCLRHYINDLKNNTFPVRAEDIFLEPR